MIRRGIESILFFSRWLLVPFYLVLVLCLLALACKSVLEIYHMIYGMIRGEGGELIIQILHLVDLTMTGSLIVIVIYSGYENFVTKIRPQDSVDWPEWMARIDFSGLKLKLMSSIVAISGIQLLQALFEMKTHSEREMLWYAAIHLIFVLSALFMALTDRWTQSEKKSLLRFSVIHFQSGNEGLLRNFNFTKLPHPLLSFFLLIKQLALT